MITSKGGGTPCLRNGRFFVWNEGSVEAEKNRSEVRFRPVAGVGFEFRLDIEDEGGADRGEQAGLTMESMLCPDKERQRRTKIKVVLRSSLYFCIYSVSYSDVSRLYMV